MSARFLGELLESCTSTNELAKKKGELGPGLTPHGTWISARHQTGGRGRLGRAWKSESGNLFLSVILRTSSPNYWTWIPLLGAVGVIDLLNSGKFGFLNSSRLSIKWPNDLWLDRRKLGGVLCEAVTRAGGDSFIVLGVGLNTAGAPEGLDQPTASLQDPSLADRIREPLVEWISDAVTRLDQDGPGFLKEAYDRCAAFPLGSVVSWSSGGTHYSAVVRSLGAQAELVVELPDGSRQSLFSEDVTGIRASMDQGPSANRR